MSAETTFSALFRKYRLKSEFETLSEFGLALAEKGFLYEESIFSHWQKGTRVPQNRVVILKLLEIFIDKHAIITVDQANAFLGSARQGYLSEKELQKLPLNLKNSIFQVPNEITNFSNREDIISRLIKKKNIGGKVIFIHGQAGVGKTSLAIHLGHLLKDTFIDGVFWFRMDTSDIMDILLSIAYSFGKDISTIHDKAIRASFVRSLLTGKNVLLIFDNVEIQNDINLILPGDKNFSAIITSHHANLSLSNEVERIFLKVFTSKETLFLFQKILGKEYVVLNKSKILELADKIGYLPLALNIFAKEIEEGSVTIKELLRRVSNDILMLEELSYDDRNLFVAVKISCKLLDITTEAVFLSLVVFNGKDFSIESVASINNLSQIETKDCLQKLKTISLIEESTKERYRIHPLIKNYLRKKSTDQTLFLKAAKYYENFLSKFDKKLLRSYPNIKQESDNVLFIFKKCYELHYWDDVIALWNPLEMLLHATNQLDKMRHVFQIVKTQKKGINIFQKILIFIFCIVIVCAILLNMDHLKTSFWNYLWNLWLGIIPLTGGLLGFFIAKSWGLFKNSLGKAVLFLSAGLFSWGFGNTIWAYYNFFLNISVPYPSLADVGYIVSYPLWTLGMMNLPHALGGKFKFSSQYRNVFVIIIPLFVLLLSYSFLIFITKKTFIFSLSETPLKLFFDIAYPAGDIVILSTALILGVSFKFFGGKYRLSIYSLIIGFCFQYIGDFLFSYTTIVNSYYNGGIVDIVFCIGLSLITFATLGFYLVNKKTTI